MEPVPGESAAKRELMEKGIRELLALKEQVAYKRRQLKAMGLNDEPELKSQLIKYPDAQAKYREKKAAKAAAPVKDPEPAKPVKASVPENSPFIDPHAPKSAPIPIPVKAPEPEPVKPAVNSPEPVKAPIHVPEPARPIRIPHGGKWF